jgi:hypothetical protein
VSAAAGLVLAANAAGSEPVEPVHAIDPNTGSHSWTLRVQGIALTLAQIQPDQVRGFYSARGFPPEAIEHLATRHCVFQTVLRNESGDGPIRFDLADWRTETATGVHRLKLVRDWLPEWERYGVSESARLAFHWALFPTDHTYEVGDWNMGMTTYALPLGTRFDLRVVYWRDQRRHTLPLPGVRCAAETVSQPSQ